MDWGGTRIGFTEVSGLDFETKVIEYREGSSPLFNKGKQPGLTEYKNITLKRGTFDGEVEFFEQWKKAVQSTGRKREIPARRYHPTFKTKSTSL